MSTAIGDVSRRDVLPARREAVARGSKDHPAVWILRLPIVIPFVFMSPEVVAAGRGRPDAVVHLVASSADTLGNAAFILFAATMAVTPIWTITGWRWHLVLRRDYGVAMFAVALTDLLIAATVTSSEFPGGFMTRVTGHSFLAAGTLATLLCLPLAVTANRRGQRALGKYWKPLHRTAYVVWVAILIHLLLLFGFHGPAVRALIVSAPLLLLRLPPVRRWYVATRRASTRGGQRVIVGVLALGILLLGLTPFVHDFVTSGLGAFAQHPADG